MHKTTHIRIDKDVWLRVRTTTSSVQKTATTLLLAYDELVHTGSPQGIEIDGRLIELRELPK